MTRRKGRVGKKDSTATGEGDVRVRMLKSGQKRGDFMGGGEFQNINPERKMYLLRVDFRSPRRGVCCVSTWCFYRPVKKGFAQIRKRSPVCAFGGLGLCRSLSDGLSNGVTRHSTARMGTLFHSRGGEVLRMYLTRSLFLQTSSFERGGSVWGV